MKCVRFSGQFSSLGAYFSTTIVIFIFQSFHDLLHSSSLIEKIDEMSSSDEESAVKSRQLDNSSDEDENPVSASRKKLSKKSRILDSDDDEDVDKSEIGTRDEDTKEEEHKSGTDSDSASEKSDSRPKKSGGKINRYVLCSPFLVLVPVLVLKLMVRLQFVWPPVGLGKMAQSRAGAGNVSLG